MTISNVFVQFVFCSNFSFILSKRVVKVSCKLNVEKSFNSPREKDKILTKQFRDNFCVENLLIKKKLQSDKASKARVVSVRVDYEIISGSNDYRFCDSFDL